MNEKKSVIQEIEDDPNLSDEMKEKKKLNVYLSRIARKL